MLLNDGDILYLAMRGKIFVFTVFNTCVGEDFNYSAILDDYNIVRELG